MQNCPRITSFCPFSSYLTGNSGSLSACLLLGYSNWYYLFLKGRNFLTRCCFGRTWSSSWYCCQPVTSSRWWKKNWKSRKRPFWNRFVGKSHMNCIVLPLAQSTCFKPGFFLIFRRSDCSNPKFSPSPCKKINLWLHLRRSDWGD